MRERRLNFGPGGIEQVGVLPTGELYVDREIASDDMSDCVLSDFVAPLDVARLKSLLAMGGAMTDEELLDRLAGRFRRGADLIKWLRACGISTAPRSVGESREHPRSSSPVGAGQGAISREFAPGTRFYEVEGVPVALEPSESGAPTVTAVDPVRREFALDAVFRSGIEIPPGRFDQLAGTFAAASRPRRAGGEIPPVRLLPGTQLFEVEGVPVALEPAGEGGAVARAFDPSPRYFPVNAVVRNGVEISREAFDELVAECREVRTLTLVPAAWPADD